MPDDALAARLARVADRFTLRLTHHGRRSGTPYQVTIWFTVDGTTVWLASADARRQWVRNVRARPDVVLEIGGERFAGVVHVLDAAGLAEAADHVGRKYWYTRPVMALHRFLGGNGLGPRGTAFRVDVGS